MDLDIPQIVVGPTTKGFWAPSRNLCGAEWLSQGHSLFDGSFSWPVMTLSASAMAHNISELAAFTDDHGLTLAPHGKSTMSPQIFSAQLDAGAWGITVATGSQLAVTYSFGVKRIFVANEILDPVVLRWISQTLQDDADAEILFYLDSEAGLEAAAAAAANGSRPLSVLIEVGHAGGRTGVRSIADAVALASRAAATEGVRVVGVSGYEGGLPDVEQARAFLVTLVGALGEIHAADLLVGVQEVIISAGGSAYFDVVADELGGLEILGHDVIALLRSGSYVTHDHGVYREKTPFNRVAGSLEPAIRIWAQVTSTPEDGLALVGMGKRDVPFDEGLPIPLRVRRAGGLEPVIGWDLTRTNDQHSYLEQLLDDATPLHPGDIVEFGISHPCTAFDKYRVIPILDDTHAVTDLAATYF